MLLKLFNLKIKNIVLGERARKVVNMGRVLGSGVEKLREFISRCLAAGGIPIIRTKYGGRRLPEGSVVVACWGKGKEVPGGTITNVPADIIEEAEKRIGDWKWLSERLGVR